MCFFKQTRPPKEPTRTSNLTLLHRVFPLINFTILFSLAMLDAGGGSDGVAGMEGLGGGREVNTDTRDLGGSGVAGRSGGRGCMSGRDGL